jgi:hypothetical protein
MSTVDPVLIVKGQIAPCYCPVKMSPALTLPQRSHAFTRLFTFALLAADVTVGRDGTALAPDDRVALPTRRTFDAPFFDCHASPFLLSQM